jgi:hypothetical protein
MDIHNLSLIWLFLRGIQVAILHEYYTFNYLIEN